MTANKHFLKYFHLVSISFSRNWITITVLIFLMSSQNLQAVKFEEDALISYIPGNYSAYSNCIYTTEDSVIFTQLMKKALESDWQTLTLQEVIEKIATHFLDYPYKAGTLEHDGQETLIINLREFDCTTFIENVIVLSQNISNQKFSFQEYCDQLKMIRYRGGIIDRYPSRLHYFSDWLYDNEKKDLVKVVDFSEHSVPLGKEINFMSTHTDSYDKLNRNQYFADEIKTWEAAINNRIFNYIPQEEINRAASGIQSGDLIAITTGIDGLDIMHTGFSIIINGELHLIHASSDAKKVIISDKSLHDKINDNKLMSGIVVALVK